MSEVGIIGQVYEDRRNGKTGKLVNRDEKCKTLMFEQEDGKTFIVSYSGFKSNMRKKLVEAAEQASVIEEESKLTDEPEISVEELLEKPAYTGKKRGRKPIDGINDIYGDVVAKLAEFVKSFNNPRVSLRVVEKKKMAKIAVDSYNVTDLYVMVRDERFKFFIKENEFTDTPWCMKFDEVFKHPSYSKPICVFADLKDLDPILENLRMIVINHLVEDKRVKKVEKVETQEDK